MNKIIVCILCLLFVSSCASTYRQYKDPSVLDYFTGGKKGGYKDYQISEDQFFVMYQGDESDSSWLYNALDRNSGYKRVYEFALQRAAEVTRQHGFRYFSIISQDEKEIKTGSAPSRLPGGTIPVYSRTVILTIQCYHESPPEGGFEAVQ